MATDNTINQNASTVHESDVEQVQLTQSGTPVQVQMPQGENVVRVQVTPGEAGGQFEHCDGLGEEEEEKAAQPEDQSRGAKIRNDGDAVQVHQSGDEEQRQIGAAKNTVEVRTGAVQFRGFTPGKSFCFANIEDSVVKINLRGLPDAPVPGVR